VAVDRFPIEEGHILLFARAVADPNPAYADAAYAATTEPGGIIAPPTFVQASAQFDPDYPLRPKLGQRWFGSGRTPTGLSDRPEGGGGSDGGGGGGGAGGGGGTGLHAEQEFEYHRPLRAGDVLSGRTRQGEQWEKQGRSGKLVFSESITEYRDQRGDLVVTARSVGVRTERPVAREAR
jgi:N-terminal half of MaoC dehydratase